MAVKPWNTGQWQKRRKEILATRNKCEWCGISNQESIEKYGKGLSIDHYRRFLTGSYLWLHIQGELYKKELGKTRVSSKKLKEFGISHKAEITAEYHRQNDSSYQKYKELRDEDIQVLCMRCHRQKGYGNILCKKCGKNYHKKIYDVCFNCHKDEIENGKNGKDDNWMQHDRIFDYYSQHPELHNKLLWQCENCGKPINFHQFCNYQRCDICIIELERVG